MTVDRDRIYLVVKSLRVRGPPTALTGETRGDGPVGFLWARGWERACHSAGGVRWRQSAGIWPLQTGQVVAGRLDRHGSVAAVPPALSRLAQPVLLTKNSRCR